jgi:hypothetical protein
MIVLLTHVDDYRAPEGALLRSSFEVAARLTSDDHDPVPIVRVSCGQLGAGSPARGPDFRRRKFPERGRAPPPERERGPVVGRGGAQAYGAPSGSTVG